MERSPRRVEKSVFLAAGLPSINGDDRSCGLEDRAEPSAAIDQNAIQLRGALEHTVLVNVDRSGRRAIRVYDNDSFDRFLRDVANKTPRLCTVDVSRRVLDKTSNGRNGSKPDNGSRLAVPPAAGGIGERTRPSVVGAHNSVGPGSSIQPGGEHVAHQQQGRRCENADSPQFATHGLTSFSRFLFGGTDVAQARANPHAGQ